MCSLIEEKASSGNWLGLLNSTDEDLGRFGDVGGRTRQSKVSRLPPSRWLTSSGIWLVLLNSTDEGMGRIGDLGGRTRQSKMPRLPLSQWLTSFRNLAGIVEFDRRGFGRVWRCGWMDSSVEGASAATFTVADEFRESGLDC
jgi:hypothetical protein